jgi:hypothetical protein
MKLALILGALFMVGGAMALGVLLRYDYVAANDQALRVNRLTGQTEVLRPGQGWREIRTAPVVPRYVPVARPAITQQPCTEAEFKVALDPATEKYADLFPESNERMRYCKQRADAIFRQ